LSQRKGIVMARRHTIGSNTYRFFVDPSVLRGEQVQIEDADLIRQLGSVLRLVAGDQVVLLDGLGNQYIVTLESLGKSRITGHIEQHGAGAGEPQLQLTLYIGLMRAERFEWLLQKGTELGTAVFAPIICERSVADGEVGAAKLLRWQRIVREAAEQSRRSRLPQVLRPQPFQIACSHLQHPALLLWEGQGAQPLRTILREYAEYPTALGIFSGPEGGLSDTERSLARSHRIQEVTLGPRTLRAETAPLVAATAIMYEFGEL
jgi:16S rRNA (uracil1498-N3)-methyltransferase